MNLRRKVWLAVVGSMLALLGVFAWLNDAFFIRQIEGLERRAAIEEGLRGQTLLESEHDALLRAVRDYAEWTETAEFLQGRQPRYAEKNWNAQSLNNIRVDATGLFSRAGEPFAGVALTETRDGVRDLQAADFAPMWSAAARVVADRSAQHRETGLIVVDGKLTLFACTPVLNDERTGEPAGALFCTLRLDDRFTERFQRMLMHPVKLEVYPSAVTSGATKPTLLRTDRDHTTVALPLVALGSLEVGRLELAVSRGVYAQARDARWWSLGQTVITGIVVGAVISLLLGYLILRRLETLHAELARVSAEVAMDARLTLRGDDEIADLAQRMNQVLDNLTASQNKARRLEKQLQSAQKMETIGQLAGGIAHDFNNCLTGMMGMMDLALLSDPPPAVTSYLERAKLSARHATGVVAQLLMFSQDRPPQLGRMRLDTLLADSLPLLQTFVASSVTIVSTCEMIEPEIEGEATQLQQLLVNLVRNAADAMEQRGRITVTLREVFLPNSTVQRGSGYHAEISVRDDGPGMNDDVMKRMFDPFFSTKPRGKGFGLGLTIVRRIVDHHHGQIDVISRVGAGTTFRVYLPLRMVAKPTLPTATPVMAGRVLVAEDNESVRLFAEALLRKKGFLVTSAADGLAAFKLFEAGPETFDIILTDLSMPEMDGRELGMRALQLNPDIALILMSGFVTEQEKHLMLAQGFAAVVDKPLTMNAILETIERVRPSRKPGTSPASVTLGNAPGNGVG